MRAFSRCWPSFQRPWPSTLGTFAGRVAVDATAFPQRSSHFVMNVHARWRDPKMDQACISWARQLFEAAKPHAAGTAYINFMPEDEVDRVEQPLPVVHRRYGAM